MKKKKKEKALQHYSKRRKYLSRHECLGNNSAGKYNQKLVSRSMKKLYMETKGKKKE